MSDLNHIAQQSYWVGALTATLGQLLLDDDPDKEVIIKALVSHIEDPLQPPSHAVLELKNSLKNKYNEYFPSRKS